jgi:AAA domain
MSTTTPTAADRIGDYIEHEAANGHAETLSEKAAIVAHMMPTEDAIKSLVAQGHTEPEAVQALDAVGPRVDATGRSISLVPFSEIEAKWTDWLWAGRLPRGMLSLLVGTEGHGKSALTLSLAAALTRGTLAGDFAGEPSSVAVLTTEDDPARTMRPRIEAAGGDMERIFHVKMQLNGQDAGVKFPDDAAAVGRALGEAGVRLCIVDPIAACLDAKVNTWKDTDVRGALTPLIVAAEEHDFALLGVLHTNKRTNATAREKAMGSVGFLQVVRSALLLGLDPDSSDESARMLAHSKCNVGRLAPSIRVKLEERAVKIGQREANYPVAVIGELTSHHADDVARAEIAPDDAGTETKRAWKMLYELLDDGPRARSVIESAAKDRKLAWRTVERAKTESGGAVEAFRVEGGKTWAWRLTDAAGAEI